MIHTIENDYLRVSVDDHGAELCSIFDKVHNREVIWQADPAYWKRHAPVLFPNVGRHFEDHYRINGVEYPSSQHGFARDSEFTCVDMTADSITHRLKSSDATRENYPYDFELKIKHVLEKNQVSVCWEVISLNDETMYFTIGGHPAFNVPAGGIGSQEQYHLTFDDRDSLSTCHQAPRLQIKLIHWSLRMVPALLMLTCLTKMPLFLMTRLKRPASLSLTELLMWN